MIQRPLSEISTNISSEGSPESCKLSRKNGAKSEILTAQIRQGETKGKLCSIGPYGVKIEGFSAEKAHHSPEYRSTLNSSSALLGQHCPRYESNTNNNIIEPIVTPDTSDPFLTSNFLNDDFDESIFEQMDALCEQNTSCNSERENTAIHRLENEIIIKNFEEDTAIQNHDVCDEMLKYEESSCSTGDQACGTKRSCESENKLTESMPEEYAKYIQSLNDKQKEAACSDTSIPLMIVAGPGSGKVNFLIPFFF